jgi:hypothetical protein
MQSSTDSVLAHFLSGTDDNDDTWSATP